MTDTNTPADRTAEADDASTAPEQEPIDPEWTAEFFEAMDDIDRRWE
jgi:hypothetical protein